MAMIQNGQQKEINIYLEQITDTIERYRNWENLQYWFRGIEKFAPFVNKIHFITSSRVPEWLNMNNPKLNVVRHSDYIPEEYLPTFSSIPIELNLHRLEDLRRKFCII